MVKKFTLALGLILSGAGVAGILTGGYGHNLVYILSGLAAIFFAMRGTEEATIFCLAFGLVYGLVAAAGFFQVDWVVRPLDLNTVDNVIHFAISAACLSVGITASPAKV